MRRGSLKYSGQAPAGFQIERVDRRDHVLLNGPCTLEQSEPDCSEPNQWQRPDGFIISQVDKRETLGLASNAYIYELEVVEMSVFYIPLSLLCSSLVVLLPVYLIVRAQTMSAVALSALLAAAASVVTAQVNQQFPATPLANKHFAYPSGIVSLSAETWSAFS